MVTYTKCVQNMKTVLHVKTDKEVKEQAQALAEHLGIPLSLVVNASLKEFVKTGEFTVRREPQLKPAVAKRLEKSIKEAREGKGLSPVFTNAEDFLKSLRS